VALDLHPQPPLYYDCVPQPVSYGPDSRSRSSKTLHVPQTCSERSGLRRRLAAGAARSHAQGAAWRPALGLGCGKLIG